MGTYYSRYVRPQQTRLIFGARFMHEVEPILEHEQAPIAQWFERGDVTAIEASAHAGASRGACQLEFRDRARPETGVRFDERGTTVDVEQPHRLAGTQHRVGPAAHAAGRSPRFRAAVTRIR